MVQHKYARVNDIEESIAWAEKQKEKKYVVWGREYDTLQNVAMAFGLRVYPISDRYRKGMELSEIVNDLLHTEHIEFNGKEYEGLTELATAYGMNPGLVGERLLYGFTLERELTQQIREISRPEFQIQYHDKIYASKRALSRELGIADVCISEMMTNNDTDYETAVDILAEVKQRAGIPKDKMISHIPALIVKGDYYKCFCDFLSQFDITQATFGSYKTRHGYAGSVETLAAMQKEMIERYTVDDKSYSYWRNY